MLQNGKQTRPWFNTFQYKLILIAFKSSFQASDDGNDCVEEIGNENHSTTLNNIFNKRAKSNPKALNLSF